MRKECSKCKIVALTALSCDYDKKKGLEECGMDTWRTKPVSVRTLKTEILQWEKEWKDGRM